MWNDTYENGILDEVILNEIYSDGNREIYTLQEGQTIFTDDGGTRGSYSPNQMRYITFDAGRENRIMINISNFEFEHSSYQMYDRLGIQASNVLEELGTEMANLNSTMTPEHPDFPAALCSSASATPYWSNSFGRNETGYIFPSSSHRTDSRGRTFPTNFLDRDFWIEIQCQYVRFYFISDSAVNMTGWEIYLAPRIFSQVNDTEPPQIRDFTADHPTVSLSQTNTQQLVTFTVDVTDNIGISNVNITGGIPPEPTLLTSENSIYTFTKTYISDNYPTGTTQETLTANATDLEGNSAQAVVNVDIVKTDYILNQPTYYIDITANLNSSITLNNGSLQIPPAIIDKSNPDYKSTYNLPSGQIVLNAGNIAAKDLSNTEIGSYQTQISINISNDGNMSSQVDITGGDVIGRSEQPDDSNKAERVFWKREGSSSSSSINSNDADVSESILTLNDVRNMMSNEINIIQELYSGNVIVSWTAQLIGVNSVNPGESPNVLDQYSSDFNRSYPVIFNEGEYITLETKYDYEVEIEDMNGVIRTIIPSTPIYARITQDENAPILR
jgi:hypothetical protein